MHMACCLCQDRQGVTFNFDTTKTHNCVPTIFVWRVYHDKNWWRNRMFVKGRVDMGFQNGGREDGSDRRCVEKGDC